MLGAETRAAHGLPQTVDQGIKSVDIPPLPNYVLKTVEKGEGILFEGFPISALVVLRSGRILTSREVSRHRIMELFQAPSVLGTEALIGVQNYEASAQALDECTVQYLPTRDLPYLPLGTMNSLLLAEVVRARRQRELEWARRVGGEAAVAWTLLALAQGPQLKIAGVSQPVIGSIGGYTREHVTITMINFQKKGVISAAERHHTGRAGGQLAAVWYLLRPDLLSVIAAGGWDAYEKAIPKPQA